MRSIVKKQTGITLIALVVTIIVLIILAGVSIAMLVGENGIITQAQRAAQETEIKGDEEKIRLAMVAAQIASNGNSNIEKDNLEIALLENGTKSIVVDNDDGTRNITFLDSKKIYKLNSDGSIEDTNSDFDSIYVAPDSQDEARNEGVIGIGTDGQPVDMDLWEYTLLENGTYVLNSKETMEALEEENWSATKKGYLGDYSSDGKIIESIPQYIKEKDSNNFISVTNLQYTFYNCIDLIVMPEIPSTIQRMENTFLDCTGLTTVSKIPRSVEIMASTFSDCKNLVNSPKIPNSVISMTGAFRNCISLKVAPNIPQNVTNLHGTFYGCESLTIAPQIPNNVTNMETTFFDCINLTTVSEIPNSVINMRRTFGNCVNLTGNIVINANITGAIIEGTYNDYESIFWNAAVNNGCKVKLSGSCSVLQQIVLSTNNPNITL